MTAAERVTLAKREIEADVASGRVPATVGSFSELHDYVDANEYGQLATPGFFDDCEAAGVDWVDVANEIQGEVDAWIKAGRQR